MMLLGFAGPGFAFQRSRRKLSRRSQVPPMSRRNESFVAALRDALRDCRRTPAPGTCRRAHSGLMPEDLMTLAHLSVSAVMNFSNSTGVSGIGSTPSSLSRVFAFGSARATFIASLSLLTISLGVFLGAAKPYQPLAS